jgi:hypothetical protein
VRGLHVPSERKDLDLEVQSNSPFPAVSCLAYQLVWGYLFVLFEFTVTVLKNRKIFHGILFLASFLKMNNSFV